MMELLFWLDEFNPSALHLFLPKKFPGEKCNEVADTSVYYHDNDTWPAHAPVCMWFDYGILNDFLKEWVVRKDELKSGKITRDEYFKWKINWPYTLIVVNLSLRSSGKRTFKITNRDLWRDFLSFPYFTNFSAL